MNKLPPASVSVRRLARTLLLVVLSTTILAGTATPSAGAEPDLAPMRLAGTDLMIDRPADWRPGGTMGYGVLVSLIGRGEGFPNFSVLTDPEFEPEEQATVRQFDRYVENLFRELLAGERDSNVDAADWIDVNGLRAHSSMTSWSTVAGRLRARRLIFAHAGRPFIVTWIERDDLFAEIGELIERSAASLRVAPPAAARGVIG